MKIYIWIKIYKNELIIFFKNLIICFVNVEADPRLYYFDNRSLGSLYPKKHNTLVFPPCSRCVLICPQCVPQRQGAWPFHDVTVRGWQIKHFKTKKKKDFFHIQQRFWCMIITTGRLRHIMWSRENDITCCPEILELVIGPPFDIYEA
jgi:hypothetical protein